MNSDLTAPMRITAIYVLIGTLWILLSNAAMWVVGLSADEHRQLHVVVDVLYVAATAGLLFFGLRRSVRRLASALEAVSHNERRWIMALDGAGHGVWDWNAATGKVFYSAGWKTMLGFEESEIGDALSEWEKRVHADDLADCHADLERHFKGDTPTYRNEHRMQCNDGQYKWILDQGMVFEWNADGTPARVVGTHTDISAQKAVEQALMDSERRLTTLMANLPGMAYRCQDDRWRTMQFASPGCLALTGYAPQELEGNRDLKYTDLVWSDDLPRMQAEIRRGWLIGEAFEIEYRLRRKDGAAIWVWERGQAIRDSKDSVGFLEGFVTEITSRKQAENAIREMNEALEQRVTQRTAELTAANRELESFTYAVSHDLRAPLRAMRGFSQALQEDYRKDLPAEALELFDQIELAGVRMGELIDALLSLSRSTRGELSRERVDLGQLAQAAHRACAHADPHRQVSVEIRGNLTVHADLNLARTLLQNLFDNAWKYTAQTETPEIVIATRKEDGETCFCIEDNGAGFDMRFADKLYEPFQRLHPQDEFAGVGVGLATVQRIVQRHGGWIKGHGEPGRGARFCFTLGPRGDGVNEGP